MAYSQKKRIDRYGLRPEQVKRVVAICVEAAIGQNVKTKMSQHFFPWSRPGCDWPFFRSYRRSAIPLIFARSFLTQEELDTCTVMCTDTWIGMCLDACVDVSTCVSRQRDRSGSRTPATYACGMSMWYATGVGVGMGVWHARMYIGTWHT